MCRYVTRCALLVFRPHLKTCAIPKSSVDTGIAPDCCEKKVSKTQESREWALPEESPSSISSLRSLPGELELQL